MINVRNGERVCAKDQADLVSEVYIVSFSSLPSLLLITIPLSLAPSSHCYYFLSLPFFRIPLISAPPSLPYTTCDYA